MCLLHSVSPRSHCGEIVPVVSFEGCWQRCSFVLLPEMRRKCYDTLEMSSVLHCMCLHLLFHPNFHHLDRWQSFPLYARCGSTHWQMHAHAHLISITCCMDNKHSACSLAHIQTISLPALFINTAFVAYPRWNYKHTQSVVICQELFRNKLDFTNERWVLGFCVWFL